MMMIDT